MQFIIKMPKLSPTMEEGTIAHWHKKEGDFVEAGDLLMEIATDKATVEHQALDEGWLRKVLVPQDQMIKISEPIAIFTTEKDEAFSLPEAPKPVKEEKVLQPEQEPKSKEVESQLRAEPSFVPEAPLETPPFRREPVDERLKASPLAKQIAKEKGLDLKTAQGSGPGGRITSKDLQKAQAESIVGFGKQEIAMEKAGSYEEIPLTPIRKIIGKRLQESKSFIPHFYVKQIIDAEPLVALREQLNALNLKFTYNDFVIRAAALALRQHPEVNRGFNSVNQSMIQFKTVDISIAVNLEAGLITPIIRYADYKNLAELSSEMRLLAEKARDGKLKEHEYKGGSFCISNLGMFGITEFTAVINPPQAAILAVGGIEESPVVKKGQIVAGKTLVLTLSVDHRVIDGAVAAKFLKTVQHLLENPVSLTIM